MEYVYLTIMLILLGMAYRFRGGGYIATGNDTLIRFVWAICLSAAYAFLSHDWIGSGSIVLTGFLSLILVPHGYAENAGSWPVPAWVDVPKIIARWPSAWMPQWTIAGWQAAPGWQKQAYDFAEMLTVGLARGIIVFVPLFVLNGVLNGHWDVDSLLSGIAAISLLQPTAYQVGTHYMPKSLQDSIGGGSWSELLNGVAWGLALLAYLGGVF